jgi:hypothetical protein
MPITSTIVEQSGAMMSRKETRIAAVVTVLAILGAIFWYTAAQTSVREAGAIVGVLALVAGAISGAMLGAKVLYRKYPRLEQPVVPPIPSRVSRGWRIVVNAAVVTLLVWSIYDPPRTLVSTSSFSAMAASVAWGIHDFLGLAPHDRKTWEARRDKLEARLARERAKAPEKIYALVSRGRDLESARFMTAMKLRGLEREVSTARDSVAAFSQGMPPHALGL